MQWLAVFLFALKFRVKALFLILDFSHLEIHRSTISREAFSQGLSVSSNPKISTYYLILPAPDNGKAVLPTNQAVLVCSATFLARYSVFRASTLDMCYNYRLLIEWELRSWLAARDMAVCMHCSTNVWPWNHAVILGLEITAKYWSCCC